MKFTKIISTALACVMAFGFLTAFPPKAAAAEVITAQSAGYITEDGKPRINYTVSTSKLNDDGTVNEAYSSFKSRQEKLDSMLFIKTVADMDIYYEAYTGEVAANMLVGGLFAFSFS